MSLFLESPLPIILIGIVIEAVLGAVLVGTRRAALIWAMVGVLVLVGLGVLVERLVETDNERIEAALDGAAAALEANDYDRLFSYIAPSAAGTRSRAMQVKDSVQFTSVSLRGLEIGPINRLTSPPSVETRFTGVFAFRDRKGVYPYEHHVLGFIVGLRQEGDRWLITDHVEVDRSTVTETLRRR